MLRLSWIEIFLRLIPEMMLMIWGIHVVCRWTINVKKYVASSIIMGCISFIIRCLPIFFGVHTFIIIVLTICTMIIIGIPLIKAIYGTLLMFTILSFSEFVNIGMLSLLHIDANGEFPSVVKKSICGIPSLIIVIIFIKLIDFILRGVKLKDVNN